MKKQILLTNFYVLTAGVTLSFPSLRIYNNKKIGKV